MPQSEQPCQPRRAGVEGRTQKRYRCRERNIVRFAVRPSFQNYVALVSDVSVNGIGFLIDQPLEKGTVLALQLRGGGHGTSMVRLAKVMHVRRHLPIKDAPWIRKKPWLQSFLSFFGGDDRKDPEFVYLVGCRFSPPLAEEDLEMICGPLLD